MQFLNIFDKYMHNRIINSKEVEFPDYMTSLPQDVINNMNDLNNQRVVSCGIDPIDKSLCVVTNNLEIRSIKPNGDLVPLDAMPNHDGTRIAIVFESLEGVYAIDAMRAIKQSVNLFEGDFTISNPSIGNLTVNTT